MTRFSASTSAPRQITLPLSKAIEIAYKGIRQRLRRSLLVTSGIILALAFLMAILTSEAMTDAMRGWIQHGPAEQIVARQRLEATMRSEGLPTTADEIADARLQSRWILSLAFLVAFVGVLNAMLMSVTERFREIGTMKCLGALDGFIVKLFIIESLFQGIAGTIAGVILGFILSSSSMMISYSKFAWIHFAATQILFDAVCCLVVGIALAVCGAIYPAWQAARMQPVEAMRVDT